MQAPRRFPKWEHSLPAEQTYYTEDVVLRPLEIVEPYVDRIHHACRALGLRTGITLVIQMRGYRDDDGGVMLSTAAISYSAETIQRLARLGLSIDHDQYVLV